MRVSSVLFTPATDRMVASGLLGCGRSPGVGRLPNWRFPLCGVRLFYAFM